MRIEGSPFSGWFTSLGGQSADSVVGLLYDGPRSSRTEPRILKWNRTPFASTEAAEAAAQFKEKSIELYQQVLGIEHIVPTDVIAGYKKDMNGLKPKVYQVQPFVSGTSAKEATHAMQNDQSVRHQWGKLGEQLFALYAAAREVNREFPEEAQFPITMTVGSSRQSALYLENSATLPKTKNIIISDDTQTLKLFDYGAYVSWNHKMNAAYDLIRHETVLPSQGVIFEGNIHDTKEEHRNEAV